MHNSKPLLIACLLGLATFVPVRSFAAHHHAIDMFVEPESFAPIHSALARADVRAALAAARTNVEANPSDANAEQVDGILEVANGNLKEAESAFTKAIRNGDYLDPSETGFERFDFAGSPLRLALDRQKVTIALGAGGAAAYNNRAAVRIVEGKIGEALQDLDNAMLRDPKWGAPSANASVAWMENNSPSKSRKLARQALDRHETSAKVYTSLAYAYLREGMLEDADQDLQEAENRDPDLPWELYVRSQWYAAKNDPRDQQRALFQALALDPNIADQERRESRNTYHVGSGTGASDYEHSVNMLPFQNNPVFQDVERNRGLVEDRGDSYNRRDYSESMLGHIAGNSRSSIYASFLNENGGRPGGEDNQFATPQDTFGYREANLGLFQNVELGAPGEILFGATYEYDHVVERSSPTATAFSPLQDQLFGFQARYLLPIHGLEHLTLGYAWSHDLRRLGSPPPGDPLAGPTYTSPVEPESQMLPDGKNKLQTSYVTMDQPMGPNKHLTYGPVMSSRNNATFALPYVDYHQTQSSRLRYRVSALPRLTDANSDFTPISSLSQYPQDNPILQNTPDSQDSQQPYLPGPNGRLMSYEFGTSYDVGGHYLTGTLFHREFRDMNILNQDPTTSPELLVTKLPSGTSTGVTLGYILPVPIIPGGVLDLGTTIQTSTGNLPGPGAPHLTSLPYTPPVTGTLGLGLLRGPISVHVKMIHVNPRRTVEETPLPTGIGAICGNCTYQVSTVAAANYAIVTVTETLANGREIEFTVQPTNTAGFYYNYPTRPYVSVNYNYKY